MYPAASFDGPPVPQRVQILCLFLDGQAILTFSWPRRVSDRSPNQDYRPHKVEVFFKKLKMLLEEK